MSADFLTGAIHWFFDTWGDTDTPVIGKVRTSQKLGWSCVERSYIGVYLCYDKLDSVVTSETPEFCSPE